MLYKMSSCLFCLILIFLFFFFFLSGHNNGKNRDCFAIHLVLSENGSVDLTSILPHGWGLGFFLSKPQKPLEND